MPLNFGANSSFERVYEGGNNKPPPQPKTTKREETKANDQASTEAKKNEAK